MVAGIGTILNKLQGAKALSGGEFQARCPAHDDQKASLCLKQEADHILIRCQAGCETADVMASIGFTMADLFIGEKAPASKGIKIVAEYNYHDEGGNTLFQVVRLEPKSFRQRHRNGGSDWSWKMDGIRRVLYHLPEILETDTPIYLVEGEKDADNLWAWGQPATTSPGGANAWHPEYADYLVGKDIIIIPDKDAAGYHYAQTAIRSLEGKAKSIKVIILPGESVKDVSDWIEQGGDPSTDLEPLTQPPETLTKLTNALNADKSDVVDITDETAKSDTSDKTFKPPDGRRMWRLVDEWLPLHVGEKFDLDTICRQLDVKTRDERHHVVKKLAYEVDKENLEKSDRLYSYINKTFKLIDWVNATSSSILDIRWPYGVDDQSTFEFDGHVTISSGDIIVVAGVSNMGKTTFCTNLVWENMDQYPCTLMGNEYAAGKFKRRVSRMNWRDPINENGTPKFELIERREKWKDIIRPNNINVIDWIGLDDNFYRMGAIIEGIQSKLKDGIAVISIQKAEGKSLGLGGGFSEHLASLYLTVDFERITVRKCKEWHGTNPNGQMYAFSIVDGGTKFHNIRTVKKCSKCGGSGTFRMGDCDKCGKTGYIEA